MITDLRLQQKLKQIGFAIFGVLFIWIAHIYETNIPGQQAFTWLIQDSVKKANAKADAPSDIVIVDINDDSLLKLGAWPWPRTTLADLAENALQRGAKIVALDITLPTSRDIEGDKRLHALALQRKLVFSQAFDYVDRKPPLMVGQPGGAIPVPSPYPLPPITAANATGYLGNNAQLMPAPCVGNIGFIPDSDGKLRRLPLITHWQGSDYLTLALAMVTCVEPSLAWWRLVTADATGQWALPWTQTPASWTAISAAELMLNETYFDMKGKWVIVGSSALGLGDRVATPLSATQAGVLVHAEALLNLINAQWHPPKAVPNSIMAWVSTFGFLSLLLMVYHATHFKQLLWVTIAVVGIWLLVAVWAIRNHLDATLVGLPVLLIFTYGAVIPVEWSSGHRRMRSQSKVLSRYVPQAVLDQLFTQNNDDSLMPKRFLITALTVDMESYTQITQQLNLQVAARLTRDILTALTEAVWQHQGTLDKYTGDGLLAFWGAPIAVADHADKAISSALAMLNAIEKINDQRQKRQQAKIRIRIGIATGEALVGDLGTQWRTNYSAVGDCLNLSARLQELGRGKYINLYIDGKTAALAQSHLLRPAGQFRIRGIAETLPVYTVS